MPTNLPETLGKYKIRREIGRGANAVVYESLDSTLDRVVALKVLNAGIFADPVLVSRFEREARSAARLDHPHIVTIYEIGEWQAANFIAMKYIAGRNLKQAIQDEGVLPLQRVASIVKQIAEALDYAHEQGLIHRDIKPSNIILSDDDWVTVTDFGLVKASESTVSVSSSGSIVGTPAYIAPEVWEGKEANAQTDIYALGVVVYEMLTSRVPFDGKTPAAVMRQHMLSPIPRITEYNAALPEQIQSIVDHALAKDVSARFQTANELAEALSFSVVAKPAEAENARPRAEPVAPTFRSEIVEQKIERSQESAPSDVLPNQPQKKGANGLALVKVLLVGVIASSIMCTCLYACASLLSKPVPTPIPNPIVPTSVPKSASNGSTAIPSTSRLPSATSASTVSSPQMAPTTTTVTPSGPQKRLDYERTLTITDIATGNKTELSTYGVLTSAAWSEDGQKILFASDSSILWDDNLRHTYGDLVLVSSEGKNQVDIAQSAFGIWEDYRDSIWSLDGKHIAVWHQAPNGQYCPSVMNSDGTGLRRLDNCVGNDFPRFWSVDGKYVITRSRDDGKLYAYEIDGTRRLPIDQLGKIQVYDERYWPWRVTDSPVCKGQSFWNCE